MTVYKQVQEASADIKVLLAEISKCQDQIRESEDETRKIH